MSQATLVFSHSITPRLQYTVDFLSQYFGLPFRLTSDEEKYLQAKDPCRINYSYHRLVPGEIFIHSHVLLSESYIRPVKVECFEQPAHDPSLAGYKAFFRAEGDMGFDLLAAIFFLLSRYEEYLPYQKDSYGRYAHQNSVAFKNDFLHLPLVNIWLEDFRYLLAEKDPVFRARTNKFAFLPTYDIDMAWSFRNKGFQRNAGGLLKLLLRARFRQVAHRLRVLRGRRPDPYDAYSWMDELHQQYRLRPIYFFLVARQKSKHDKNINTAQPNFRQLLKRLSASYDTGLHPSWASGDLPSLLTREKTTLEQITEKPVHASRQHFIRFDLPATYRKLLALGITHDHSMGYGSINGFRASVALPFYWYDLKAEEKTKLLLHPFCFMDANAYYEEGLSAASAGEELERYHQTVRAVDGLLVTIWHNSFLGTGEEFSGWRELYRDFVARVTSA